MDDIPPSNRVRDPHYHYHHPSADTNTALLVGENSEKHLKGVFTSTAAFRYYCYGLHVILVCFHLTLLGIWIPHLEHRILVPLSKGNLVSTIVIVVVQAFITLYSAGMVVVTQQLALTRNLSTRQTLTATNDKAQAWTGLGAALLTLYRQTAIRSSIGGPSVVALYLLCIAILHITTPSIIYLNLYNNPEHGVVPSKLALPVFEINTTSDKYGEGPYTFWRDRGPLLSYLSRVPESSTLGLHNGTLYDVLQTSNNGVYNVPVNSSTFNITCGFLPNITVTPIPANESVNVTNYVGITSTYEDYFFNLTASVVFMNTLVLTVPLEPTSTKLLGRNYIFMSSTNLTDSYGSVGSVAPFDPPMAPVVEPGVPLLYGLQVMGCTASLYNQTVNVSSSTKQLVTTDLGGAKNSSQWQPWRPQLGNDTLVYGYIADPLLDGWGNIFDLTPQTTEFNAYVCPNASVGGCFITVAEQFVMGDMGMDPYESVGSPLPQFTLHQFENSVSKLSAAAYWAAGNIPLSNFDPTLNAISSTTTIVVANGTAKVSELVYQVDILITPLAVGLSVSILLLLIVVVLLPKREAEAPVADVGILQLLWLLSRSKGLREWTTQVENPSISNLRAAGMFQVRLADVGWNATVDEVPE